VVRLLQNYYSGTGTIDQTRLPQESSECGILKQMPSQAVVRIVNFKFQINNFEGCFLYLHAFYDAHEDPLFIASENPVNHVGAQTSDDKPASRLQIMSNLSL
jgi:hypothetical protein